VEVADSDVPPPDAARTEAPGDVRELRGAWGRDHREGAVVAGDADAGDGDGLAGGKTVGRGGGDGDEKAVFDGAGWAGDNRDQHVFVDNRGPAARAALAYTIEICVVVLARQVVTDLCVADG
jgi:hypothetical protein